MRGKVRRSFNICPRFRITPAYAGKSNPAASLACIMRDHPRLCGEKNAVRFE